MSRFFSLVLICAAALAPALPAAAGIRYFAYDPADATTRRVVSSAGS